MKVIVSELNSPSSFCQQQQRYAERIVWESKAHFWLNSSQCRWFGKWRRLLGAAGKNPMECGIFIYW